MKILSSAICLLSLSILSGCVDGRDHYGSAATVVRDRSCGNGPDDVTHPYAGRCDWRRENGRDWADSGGNNGNSVYIRGR